VGELKTRIKIVTKSNGGKSYTPQWKWGFIWISFSKSDISRYELCAIPKRCITKVTNNKDMCMAFLDRRRSQWYNKKVTRRNNKTTNVTYEIYPA
jgi:hypothetical protein